MARTPHQAQAAMAAAAASGNGPEPAFGHDAGQPQRGPALPTGTLTFCFTDIEGSTQLWEQYPQAMPAALARHDAILHAAIDKHCGMVFKTAGDGVHAVFARASDALAAAIAAQRTLHAEPWPAFTLLDSARSNIQHLQSKFVLRVRIALHSGVAEERAGDYFGPVLNRVARILGVGHGGQVLLSHTTYDLVADDLPAQIALHALGEYQLKDLTRPEQIFQLISPDLPSAFPPLRTLVTASAPAAEPPAQLLATKLYIPPVRSNLVSRQHLIDRLQAGLSGKLTLIAAPAGFGKTTLAAEWLTKLRIETEELRKLDQAGDSQFAMLNSQFNVAWVALDKGDNDPIRFWSYVIAAFDALRTGVGTGALGLLQSPQPPPIKDILTTLLNTLSTWPTPIVLMLDDYHTIETPSIHQALAFLLDHLPHHLHLVIASRADPPLSLSRLRARAELTELRAADLRFTPDEAAEFLAGVLGVRLSAEAVVALETRTEGWIAGLQFAALAMRDRTDMAGFIAAFTGSNRFVMDYLVEEVLHQLPRHLHTFLLDTSILDRLCGSLCDAVLGLTPDEGRTTNDQSSPAARERLPSSFVLRPSSESYSQLILDQLERANLFLVPLDDDRHWYRFHPLFAEVLRSRLLSGASTAHVATLHQRASVWFEQQGLDVEAVAHALFTLDQERIARLIEHYAWSVIYRGQIHTTLDWFDALPAAFIHKRPHLCVLHAQMLMHTNQLAAAEACLQVAEQSVLPDTPEDLARSVQGRVLTTRANISFYNGDLARSVVLGQQALNILPDTISIAHPAASAFAAQSFLVTGDVTPATERHVAAVAPSAHAVGNRFVQLRGYTLLAELRVLQGCLQAAAATYREAAQLAPEPGVLASMIGSPAYYFGLGDLYREWDDLVAAEQLLLEGMHRAIGAVTPNAFYLRQGCIALARLQHARADHTAALATLGTLADLGRQRTFDPLVLAQGRAVQAQLALAQGQLDAAIAWADTSGLHAEDPLSFSHELEHLVFARVLIARGRGEPTARALPEALNLLDRLLVAAETNGRMRSVIEIVMLRTLALAAQGDIIGARTLLERALTLAAPEGYIRMFVDEGAPMRLLIDDCRGQIIQGSRSAAGQAGQRVLAYVDILLAHFADVEGDAASPIDHPQSTIQSLVEPRSDQARAIGASLAYPPTQIPNLIEPLSERELEVLRLIGAGHSNQAIADTLIIAVSTVKRHINNIYGKLDVQSRTQALARARELDIF